MSGIVLAISGLGVHITGVEDHGDVTWVYVGHRYKGIHFCVVGEAAERVKREWNGGGHVLMHRDEVPPLMGYDRSCAT